MQTWTSVFLTFILDIFIVQAQQLFYEHKTKTFIYNFLLKLEQIINTKLTAIYTDDV